MLLVLACLAELLGNQSPVAAAAASYGWSSEPTYNYASSNNYLYGISCVTKLYCIGVGSYYGSGQTIGELWNGSTWSQLTTLNPSGTSNDLAAVSCTSTTFCLAVGSYNTGGYSQTLAESWNGTAWSNVLPNNPGGTATNNQLTAVDCLSPTYCIGVGWYCLSACTSTTHIDQVIIEEFTGSGWTTMTGYNTSTSQQNQLQGISCVSTSFCFAVGQYYTGTYTQALGEFWDGSTWASTNLTNYSTTVGMNLYSVSCVTTTFCMVVGTYYGGTPNGANYAEYWNGTAWNSENTLPNPGPANNLLTYVDCTSISTCVASADYTNAGGTDQASALEYASGTWTVDPNVPNSSSTLKNYVFTVSCTDEGTFCAMSGLVMGSTYYSNLAIMGQLENALSLSITVTGAALSFSSAPSGFSFQSITLNGTTQTVTGTQSLDIGDLSGSGSGWNVSLSATPFTNGVQQLSNTAFTVPVMPTVSCQVSGTCVVASLNTALYAYTLPAPATGSTKLLSAAAGSGMGNQVVSIVWNATLPGNTYAGSYTSTWQLTLAAGP
ncbi:MAG: hypothetical protein ACP5OR_05865 [Candidatus Dormibacteria bacterium]